MWMKIPLAFRWPNADQLLSGVYKRTRPSFHANLIGGSAGFGGGVRALFSHDTMGDHFRTASVVDSHLLTVIPNKRHRSPDPIAVLL